jgi:hypothetical protein
MPFPSSSDIAIFAIVLQYVKYTYIILLTIGVIGNCLNILVFTNLKLFHRNQCAFYLCVESIINVAALILTFIDRITQYSDGHDLGDYSLVWCKIRMILDQTVQLIPFSVICFTAFDQLLSTSHRYTLRQMSTFKLAQRLIFIVTCIAIIHSILPIFWFALIPPIGCLPSNKNVLNYFLFFYYPILVGILPIFISSLFSLIAFRNVRHIIRRQVPIVRRKLDHQLTAMVFTRVIAFILLYLPYIIYRIFTIVKIASSNYDIPFLFDMIMQTTVIFLKDLSYAVRSFFFMSNILMI